MAQPCKICGHPSRAEIDQELAGGKANRAVARQFGVSKDSVSRHRKKHLSARLTKAHRAQEVAQADTLLEQLRQLQDTALRIGRKAEQRKDYRTALQAVRESVRIVQLLGQMRDQFADPEDHRVVISWEGGFCPPLPDLADPAFEASQDSSPS